MDNAHLRMGIVEYNVTTKSYSTRVQAFCDRIAMDAGQTHMLSIFGNDAEIAAISAAISTGAQLTAMLPDGTTRHLSLGDDVTNHRGHIQIADRKRPIRHLPSPRRSRRTAWTARSIFSTTTLRLSGRP